MRAEFYSTFLARRWYRSTCDVGQFNNGRETIDRVHRISYEEFKEKYEKINKPCVITGALDDWPARENWTKEV